MLEPFYKFVYTAISRRPEARMDEADETVNGLAMAQPAFNEVVINLAVERKQRLWMK
jgi:hypothetical protein